MITVAKNTRAYAGTVFFEGLVYRVSYWLWRSGIIPDEIGAYADNEDRPNRDHLRHLMLRGGIFCQGVPNVYLRLAGLEVPYRAGMKGEKAWDGSISAAWDGAFGQGYYHDEQVDYDPERAIAWAREERSPTLVGCGYHGAAPDQQGHTELILPSGYALQSTLGEGLNWSHRAVNERQYWNSHNAKMVHPKKWIELEGEERRRRLAPWAKAA